jgi:DNA adenine methylase
MIMQNHLSSRAEDWTLIGRYPTPLRYPGGKHRLGGFFAEVLTRNDLLRGQYLEPFAGSAGVGLYLLQRGLVESICLNDFDRAIYAFWFAVTRRNAALCKMIERTSITVAEWDRQKEVQRHKADAPLLELGFSTLFLNRTNRSGILRAGMVGGRQQRGKWRIDARFNRAAILQRVAALHPFASRISIACTDAVEFLSDVAVRSRRKRFTYLDPPYFVKGRDLYLNRYTSEDHSSLAAFVKDKLSCSWVLTYDDVPTVRRLYKGYRMRSYRLAYSADTRRARRYGLGGLAHAAPARAHRATVSCVDLHGRPLAVPVGVSDVRGNDGAGDCGLRSRVGVFRWHLYGPDSG